MLGFRRDPFAYANADEEEFLSSYFIPPPYFPSVVGTYHSPTSCIVVAPRGAGKTAQRRMVEYWAADKPILCVTYDRFDFPKIRSIQHISLDYHLKRITQLVLIQLFVK
ncbi:MAG: hypothetical protein AAFR59_18920, partial [Bacteroidota bacterium]